MGRCKFVSLKKTVFKDLALFKEKNKNDVHKIVLKINANLDFKNKTVL